VPVAPPPSDAFANDLRLIAVVAEDFSWTTEQLKKYREIPAMSRIATRAAASNLEVAVWILKRVILQLRETRRITLDEEHLALLQERVLALDDNGKPTNRPWRFRLVPNYRYTFRLVESLCGIAELVPAKAPEWQGLVTLVKIRNRLTHPKRVSDLDVTDADVIAAMNASTCFSRAGRDALLALTKLIAPPTT
jgi:hypothetical protein